MSAERCEAKVWDSSGWYRHTCLRRGVELVGTGWYCKQHAKIEARRIERDKRHPVKRP